MLKATMIAGAVATMALASAYAQDKGEWCTDAHMQEMDQQVAQLSDESKKQEADKHLQLSKDAMQQGDTQGCIQHMEEAHAALGIGDKSAEAGEADADTGEGGGTGSGY